MPNLIFEDFEYSRSGNPTRQNLEVAIATLEGGRYGLAFSSGMAAIAAIGSGLMETGSHAICVNDIYGGTYRYFVRVLAPFGVETTFTPMTDPQSIVRLLRSSTRLIWIESPTNPTVTLVDIAQVVEIARAHNPSVIVVVDNTLMTPYFQRPLEFGADLVTHSATKYLNGHCDVICGLIVTSNAQLYEKLKFHQNALGAVPSPFDCYLLMRGMQTLHLRMDRHELNAMAIARFLESHARVKKVMYPGLPSHPQHKLACSQQRGFGGLVSFVLEGDLEDTRRFCQSVSLFTLAESLGGVESLLDVPAIMTHGSVPVEDRNALGITDSFIRLSVGIEDVNDLIQDLANAFSQLG